ncbi:Cytokinin hydroxylase [Acorus gramineus]|uniref:Cytokinin hydroxylase n=1 Tax=Acorus gramineus TaxID=55184 RepID=A0AAV9ARF0_ACOGR|nr:Cytokinin hydroxylase [Acorus gramineus]
MSIATLLFLLLLVLLVIASVGAFIFLVSPGLTEWRLRKNGFTGPTPSFPLGNILDMCKKEKMNREPSQGPLQPSHDIHSLVFPYFARWCKSYGKVFIYWLGTEPFLYVAEPEYIKNLSSVVAAKNWGKPTVFKRDRKPMFGDGLIMVEGDNWVRHRHITTPAFSTSKLNAMISSMVESTSNMLGEWSAITSAGAREVDIERDIIRNASEIIAKASFGINNDEGKAVFEKLKAMQAALFTSNRLVGVPFSKYLHAKETLKTRRLGEEIDGLLFSIIESRNNERPSNAPQHDLLGLLIAGNQNSSRLTSRELVDECKTFFFGGHETTALALTWTLFLLALNPRWQTILREEITEAMGGGDINSNTLTKLTKMTWVMNEALRLYSPAPNVQRQVREDIRVGDNAVIPKGTNIWIDVVGMHHDRALWGDDVNEFRPERFQDSPYGGCKHRMGFLPFGFGGRVCVGRNLSMMEYKIVLSLVLQRFSLSLSPNYNHSPSIMLSLRPSNGMPLILEPL